MDTLKNNGQTDNHSSNGTILTEDHSHDDDDRSRLFGATLSRRFRTGDEILGRYVVKEELGQGGMGIVYHCLDKVGNTDVAVKCLPPEVSHNPAEMEDVRDNYTLVTKLAHPNIAICKTLERDGDTGDYYLVMDYVDGESLRQWMRRQRRERKLSLETSLPILQQIAEALDAAHRQGVIHRDVKPDNVKISTDGTVKVLDFGLAAQVRSSMAHFSKKSVAAAGTNLYKSPEQWRASLQQGEAADQYSLAVTAYEMLSGHAPFESDSLEVLERNVVERPRPVEAIEGLPTYANAALASGLAKDAKDRYVSCVDFVRALGGEKVKPGRGMPKRNGGLWLVAAVVAVVLAAGSAVYFMRRSDVPKVTNVVQVESDGGASEEDARAKVAAEKKAADEARQKAEQEERERKVAEAEAEKKATEAARQKAAEEARLAEQKKSADEARRKAEREFQEAEAARQAAEAKAAAEKKAADEARKEAEKMERERQAAEAARLAVEKKAAEEARLAEQQRKAEEEARRKDAWTNSDRIFSVNGVTLTLKPVRRGRFQMGSPESEAGRSKDETQHWVTLTEDFWMGETEVTQAQWKAMMGTTLPEQADKQFPGKGQNYIWGQGDNYPMYFVSWEEARDFCRKLTSRERDAGKLSNKWEFTLPTEAQWEYAARGGDKSNGYRKYSGGDTLEWVGWYFENSGQGRLHDKDWKLDNLGETLKNNRCATHPVGMKSSNELGLFDMSGNVWEWCLDYCDNDKDYNVITNTYTGNQENPLCRTGSRRVRRGGSWFSSAASCRSSYRGSGEPTNRYFSLGFRVALVPVQ
ncbi:MAG: SUMF1/EgtB/PvdO family nonheme iron enzyme [Lentisphaeria bacterium]|nr:SUMF1/EgtB/PvdO family nonheme iron enzyme [Lentisphaeria bacterium]